MSTWLVAYAVGYFVFVAFCAAFMTTQKPMTGGQVWALLCVATAWPPLTAVIIGAVIAERLMQSKP